MIWCGENPFTLGDIMGSTAYEVCPHGETWSTGSAVILSKWRHQKRFLIFIEIEGFVWINCKPAAADWGAISLCLLDTENLRVVCNGQLASSDLLICQLVHRKH